MAADTIIGDGLVDSPYEEMKKLAELWEKNYYNLLEIYTLEKRRDQQCIAALERVLYETRLD